MWKKLLFTFLFISCSIWAGTAAAGCKINIGVENTGDFKIKTMKLKVKSKGGTWAVGSLHGWMNQRNFDVGESYSGVYDALAGCKAKRRYRVLYYCDGILGEKVTYFPSATGWTKNTNPVVKLSRCKN